MGRWQTRWASLLAPRWGTWVAVLLLAGPAWAQPACPPAAPVLTPERVAQAQRNARDHGLLWRVEKGGRLSWLYGTLHLARLDWLAPGPTVRAAFQRSDLLALELNLLDTESLKPLTAPADPARVRQVMTDVRRARLARAMASACVPEGALDGQRPAMQAAALAMMAGRGVGLHAEWAIDALLAGAAQRLNKPVVALESAADQLALLTGADATEEGELVDGALDELESGQMPGQLDTLAQAWARGDEALLADYPRWCRCLNTARDRAQWKRVLDDRNGPMAERIVALHDSGRSVFAAVGALHVVGPQGLPALLRARGFRVVRVVPGRP